MLRIVRAALLTASLSAPAIAFAGPIAMPPPRHGPDQVTDAPAATHSVRGIVKTVTPAHLVITRATHQASEMDFVTNAATLRTGTIAAGATVSVRYRVEGRMMIATAIVAKQAPSSPPALNQS